MCHPMFEHSVPCLLPEQQLAFYNQLKATCYETFHC